MPEAKKKKKELAHIRYERKVKTQGLKKRNSHAGPSYKLHGKRKKIPGKKAIPKSWKPIDQLDQGTSHNLFKWEEKEA